MSRLILLLTCVAALAGCAGRPLAPGERAFAEDVFGPGLDPASVRVVAGFGAVRAAGSRPLPPKSDRIDPRPGVCDRTAPSGPEGPPPAWALWNTVHIGRAFYRDDTLPGWPDQVLMPQVFVLAHELLHVWQWQNRRQTGYRPARAGLENFLNLDPYFYVPEDGSRFLDYGYEQQATLIEDYFCYGIFDPQNPRRATLRAILAPHFRVDQIDAVLAR